MQENKIHVVFQVLNFLTDPSSFSYDLLLIDKFILIILAKHHGELGIFPKQETLAKEANLSKRYTRERLLHLQKIGLISVKKINRRHHYFLEFLSTTVQPQLHSEVIHNEIRVQPQLHSECSYRSSQSAAVVPTNNIINNPINKTEGGESKKFFSPIPSNFYPNKQSQKLAEENGFDESVVQVFIDYCSEKGKTTKDPQALFRKFIRDEATYLEGKERSLPTDPHIEYKDHISELPRGYTPEEKKISSETLAKLFEGMGMKGMAAKIGGLNGNGKGHSRKMETKGSGRTQ